MVSVKPLGITSQLVEDVALCAHAEGWEGALPLVLRFFVVLIAHVVAFGGVRGAFFHLFPPGSFFDVMQGCEILPVLNPVLDLTKSVILLLESSHSTATMLHWRFLHTWLDSVHRITFGCTLFLLLFSVILMGLSFTFPPRAPEPEPEPNPESATWKVAKPSTHIPVTPPDSSEPSVTEE